MAVNETLVDSLVLPGDVLGSLQEADSFGNSVKQLKLGPGILENEHSLVCCKAGILRGKQPSTFWIESNHKRYVPVKEENVIGIVTSKGAENYKVDIGSSLPAILGNLSFEGATKRNRKNLQIGDLVYCKLAVANKDMEPEVTCVNPNGKSDGLGSLSGGFMFQASLGLARKLLARNCCVLQALGKSMAFEITVGMNGRIWINSKSQVGTIAILNCIDASEFMDDKEIKTMVNDVVSSLRGF